MRKSFLPLLSLIVFSLTFTVNAESVKPGDIPEKVVASIMKRHPKAQDLQASHEQHFGKKLLEISFKDENNQPVLELFTPEGHLFTSELAIESLNELSPLVIEALNRDFPHYSIRKAEMVGNPNGVGEEYEVYISADNINWKVSIDDHGKIIQKDRD